MPQCLAVKRLIKKKLNTSANKQVRYKPIGFFKVLKYAFEIKASKVYIHAFVTLISQS